MARGGRLSLRVLFDSIDVAELPPEARAVAGYVDGAWPTFPELERRFPRAWKLSIATNPRSPADVLDVERGDATLADAAPWWRRQIERGVTRHPTFYVPLAGAQALVDALMAAGVARSRYYLWTAHWTRVLHVCGPACGYGLRTHAGATQVQNGWRGRNVDVTAYARRFS